MRRDRTVDLRRDTERRSPRLALPPQLATYGEPVAWSARPIRGPRAGVLALTAAAAMLPGCGSRSAQQAGADAVPDATPVFSAAAQAEFHLIPDGHVQDGRSRMLYAPKVAWLDRFGTRPQLTEAALPGGQLSFNGIFNLRTPGVAALASEAAAHNVALVTADLALPHVTCGMTQVLTSLTLRDGCSKPAELSSFATVGFAAAANAAAASEVAARIAAHQGGGAWDDVVIGDIAWQLPGGDVLHTRLEVDCIAGFDGNGGAIVADTPACTARYQL